MLESSKKHILFKAYLEKFYVKENISLLIKGVFHQNLKKLSVGQS